MDESERGWWACVKSGGPWLWLVAMLVAMWWLWRSGSARVGSGWGYVGSAYAAMEILGFIAGCVLHIVEWDIKKHQYGGQFPVPSFYPRDLWKKDIVERTPGGWWLAFFERVIYLGAALLGKWELVAGYLVLKSASKWKAWTTTADVLKGQYLDDIRANLARAGLDHRTFLVGTVGNLVAALGGYGVAEFLKSC